MRVISDPLELQAWCRNRGVGLVPTMGALHEGHLSLVRASRRLGPATVVSIFVNPTQFGPQEDFSRYPRPFDRDCALLAAEDVDIVFAPSPEAMYPPGDQARVDLPALSRRLDGASRPGHFLGVATVVLKLLHLAAPARAWFGQKDAAQLALIRRLCRDLFVPVEILAAPIVRDADGLALSSRNAFLSPAERRTALALPAALQSVATAFAAGESGSARLLQPARQELEATPGLRLDYFEAVDPDSLDPVPAVSRPTLIAVAAWVGATRLIDNVVLSRPPAAR